MSPKESPCYRCDLLFPDKAAPVSLPVMYTSIHDASDLTHSFPCDLSLTLLPSGWGGQ